KAQVSRRERDNAVGQTEPAQHVLRVPRKNLEGLVGMLWKRKHHDLDLLELMLSDHAARVTPGRARFRTEAGSPGRVANGKARGRQDLVAVHVGQRDLGGRNQV